MATATKNYKPMTDVEREAFRASQRVAAEAARSEEAQRQSEHQARLDRVSDESVDASIAALSDYDLNRLTKWAKTRMKAAGFTSVRDDSEKLASVRRDIMRELLSSEMNVSDIEED